MGADHSKGKRYSEAAKYGQLFIQTDKSTYFGGETVTGKIYLNLFLPYPGNQLFLKLRGKEFVAFVRQKAEHYTTKGANGQTLHQTRYVDELFHEKSDIIKMVLPLYSWSVLLPGQYTIPFAFLLPGALPNTFFQEGNRYRADINYQLEAILEPSIKTEPKLKFKQEFVVRSPVRNAVQGVANEVKTEIKTCLCMSKGYNVLRAHFEKNFYAPGETAQVIMQLDNGNCQTSSTTIVFNLKQKLQLTAKGRQETKEFIKVQRNLDGIGAGASSDSNLIAINLPPCQERGNTKFNPNNLTQYLKSLQEANGSLNSASKGRLITSEYFLQVSCPMDGCCATTPAIRCPIEIYYPEIQLMLPSVPVGWAPQEIGTVNLSFADAPLRVYTGQNEMTVNTAQTKDNIMSGMMTVGNMMAAKLPGLISSGSKGGSGSPHKSAENYSTNADFQEGNGDFQVTNQQPAGIFSPNGGQENNGDSHFQSGAHYETHSSTHYESSDGNSHFSMKTNVQSSGNNNNNGGGGFLGGFGQNVLGNFNVGNVAGMVLGGAKGNVSGNTQSSGNMFL